MTSYPAVKKLSPLLGESPAIENLREFIVGVSLLDLPVLLLGDSGTGKDLAARKIHAVGRTARAPFVKANPELLNESEFEELLFDSMGDGRESGVLRSRLGSTCYIPGVEQLSPHISRELLRHLMDDRYRGESSCRLLFGSEYSFDDLRSGGLVEAALLEQISRLKLAILPLRERVEDIPILCHYQIWLNTAQADYDACWIHFRDNVLPGLMKYPWPGNVGELEELMHAYCQADGSEREVHLPIGVEGPAEYLARIFAGHLANFRANVDRYLTDSEASDVGTSDREVLDV